MTANNDQFSPDMVAEEETLTPFDVRDSSGRQGLVKLLIGTAILLAVAFFLLKFYQPGVRDRDTPPRITAENTPFKVEPEDPGGMQVPNQDRGVFDVMDGNAPEDVVTDVKTAEVPITLPKPKTDGANIQVDPPASGSATVPVKPEERETIAPRSQVESTPPLTTVKTPAPDRSIAPRTGSSDFVVQVASVRSQADAQATWNRLETRFPNLLSEGVYADIKRVDLEDKGIYYRTRVAGLADRAAANALCASFKDANQACFVTRR